ncbi:hypothetical protein LSCM1_07586 [Leishmania martiniquensis]|uniref:Zeta toxin domain-containing protein n=1 Tax=Leishmania martiniquensis TaxID=1580590 RepID=A0A836HWE7_9TRYP|nr:hypothetical protein LSCM1_07586 [Leishmania martiniquensis]
MDASPSTRSSRTVASVVAPPSIDEALPYWIGLSRLIHCVCVTPDSAPAADERAPADQLQNGIGSVEGEPSTFTRYALHRLLVFCGIKQHRARQAADHVLAHLLSAVYTTAASASALRVPVVLLDSGSQAPKSCSSEGQLPVPLPVLVVDWPTQSSAHDQVSVRNRYCLRVPVVTWNRSIVKCLGSELRGQMISLRPLFRWNMACAQQSGRMPVVIFVGGTSGTGKSTLASLVASQLRIPNVLSTDTVRQVLRERLRGHEAQYPALFVSSYEAHKVTVSGGGVSVDGGAAASHEKRTDEDAIVQAYEAQGELVLRALDGVLARLLVRRESIVVEGVHLLPQYLAAKRAELLVLRVACIPVLVRIPKADSHLERLCVRARGMSMRAQSNKYIASFNAIRTIQHHLINSVESASLPVLVLSNTNMDKSLTVVHHTLLETMEYAALHGWPADAAAASEVPLTGLVFRAVKDKVVAVVRQRRCRRCAVGDNLRTSNETGASEWGGGGKVDATMVRFSERGSSPQVRLPAHASVGGSAAPRARSAELLGVVQRCLLEQGLRYHSCTSSAQVNTPAACGSSGIPCSPEVSHRPHVHAVSHRSSTIEAKSHIIPASSSHRLWDDLREEFDEAEVPSLIGS